MPPLVRRLPLDAAAVRQLARRPFATADPDRPGPPPIRRSPSRPPFNTPLSPSAPPSVFRMASRPPPGPNGTGGGPPPSKPDVPSHFQAKSPSTTYFPPASAAPSSHAPSSPFGHNTQTYLPSSAFTPTSFGAGWQGSVLSTFGPGGSTAGDASRMQAAEALAPPGWDTARQIAALQVKLDRSLGPEYVSQRLGGGGQKFTYIEGWKVINIANEIFGFNGWSSSILALDTDFIDTDSSGKHTVGVTARIRVTLRDGAYHEDCGYGSMANSRDKAAALEKCKKEAVTDALKRALRSFGNVLGNCLYDKTYESKIKTVKTKPVKFDERELYRRPEFDTYNSRAGILTDPTASSASASAGGAPASPAGPPPTPAKPWAAAGNLARTAMSNSAAGSGPAQRRPTVGPAAQQTPVRPPPAAAAQQHDHDISFGPTSSQPEGLADLSAVDLDAVSVYDVSVFTDDGVAGMIDGPMGGGGGGWAGRTTTTAARSAPRPAQKSPSSGPPPMKAPLQPRTDAQQATSAPASTTVGPGAAARSPIGGFSFATDKKPQQQADQPPPGMSEGQWKRQKSVRDALAAKSSSGGRPSSGELEGAGVDGGAGGPAAKRARVEYGGHSA